MLTPELLFSPEISKLGIAISQVKQPVRGSPTEKAHNMAIALSSKTFGYDDINLLPMTNN